MEILHVRIDKKTSDSDGRRFYAVDYKIRLDASSEARAHRAKMRRICGGEESRLDNGEATYLNYGCYKSIGEMPIKKILPAVGDDLDKIGGSAFSAADRADVREMLRVGSTSIGRATRAISRAVAGAVVDVYCGQE